MGRRRNFGRRVDGVLLLDKPLGITSNDALQRVKRLFKARKAGHTGSLDPLASGMLPLCMGEATKFSAFLLDADKFYRVECKLGEKSSTGDSEGEIIDSRPVPELDEPQIEAVLSQFRGEIMQLPPMFSALKHQGKRLYELAREGIEVEREPRPVTIHELTFLSIEGDRLRLDVRCSKGTYVRTLAEDIGEVLGCGAHVSELRRLEVGPYKDVSMVTLEQIEAAAEQGNHVLDELLLPIESAIADWPDLMLNDDAAYYIKQGQPVMMPKAPRDGCVRLYNSKNTFLGVGEMMDDGRVAPKRLIQA
ncbi:tRNA pseudouridine(55) synthase TruB [Solemya pervernicosa gill symbiont]|uniref:tRNA pseudouridine synthase B n=2 Tax=Gammaproteobacteria incertae sedis TaxID=118884 RepID=A0A1T2L9E4_9GAMM|nr:tRNA pseudouridine(55) synthase TruB [Candidatus Reidiella endopervernicosa]OOZ41717.1 tRNA pseudouridine(55) synthase TruB [Solemya pervernicosa gill symbiont]QKQ26498.1 tRNA pseudouridine(55) synthase TruB [Candidatus Reidiella endopervernicosa]